MPVLYKELVLSSEEREVLERYVRRHKTSQQLAFRSRIILACADLGSIAAVARELGASRTTISQWRRRFIDRRLDGLSDEPRPGAPRTITDEQVERVIVATLESTPKGATHWSKRSMAKHSGLSQSTIGRIWKAFGLAPHRTETFSLSTDPNFIEKVRDVVGLYMSPPANAVVFCVDEKSNTQALERRQPLLPMRPGQAERGTHTYRRHGTTSLFAALEVATGKVIGRCYKRHRTREFIRFLREIDNAVPEELEIHVIMDNLKTHKSAEAQRWFAKHPRFHVHFTPTYSSWLNQVERWFALLTEKQIKRGSHRSVAELEAAIYEFIEASNDDPRPFVWTKTADQILDSIRRFCERNTTA